MQKYIVVPPVAPSTTGTVTAVPATLVDLIDPRVPLVGVGENVGRIALYLAVAKLLSL